MVERSIMVDTIIIIIILACLPQPMALCYAPWPEENKYYVKFIG